MNVKSKINLDYKSINFSPASIVDGVGRVFFYDNRVFRAINNDYKESCLELLNSDLFSKLIQERFMPRTWISEFQLEDCELVLEHEKLLVSEVHHWSFTMLKDAAIFMLELNKRCNQYGYTLKDAHPFNIVFDHNRPIFIDIGSFIKDNSLSGWRTFAYEEFITTHFVPLLLWSRSEYFMARRLIEDGIQPALRTIPMKNVLDSEFGNFIALDLFDFKLLFREKLLVQSRRKYFFLIYGVKMINKLASLVYRRNVEPFQYLRTFKPPSAIENKIQNLFNPSSTTAWGKYHDTYFKGDNIISTPRFDRIIQTVQKYASDGRSSLDLAGNQGVFSYLLSQRISLDRVVLTDYDENAIDKAYKMFKKQNIDIEAYLFNFMRPLRMEEIYLFKSDIVFALAITHHLILKQKYLLPVILDRISRFSNKYVFIEFMPLGLWSPGFEVDVPHWYNIEWFRFGFEQFFETLTVEELTKNRIIFVGKKLYR